MEKVLGGIAHTGSFPAALFLVDIGHEHIALAEAKRLGVTTFGMVDTNCDPNKVDFAIPANDDATKSIAIITNYITAAIAEGLAERQVEKEEDDSSFDEGEEGGRDRGGRGGNRGGGRGPGGNAGGPGGAPKRRVPSTQKRTSAR
jgi:small subunit ribosomal protein S2